MIAHILDPLKVGPTLDDHPTDELTSLKPVVLVVPYDVGILDPPRNLGMGLVLVEPDTPQHGRVLKHTAGYLFNLGIPLDVNLLFESAGQGDHFSCAHGNVAGKVAPPGDELGSDAALDDIPTVAGVLQVDLGGGGAFDDDDGGFLFSSRDW